MSHKGDDASVGADIISARISLSSSMRVVDEGTGRHRSVVVKEAVDALRVWPSLS